MNIIIADDHELVAEALATLVERDQPGSKVLKVGDFDSALGLVNQHPDLDLVLLDVYMPGMDIQRSLQKLGALRPELPVVLMSGSVRRNDVDLAFEHGARGFIPKTMNGKALVSVLTMVMSGSRYVPEMMLENTQRVAAESLEISPREIEVLDQLTQGYSNKVIARNLGIEETTVKLHLRSVFRKLDVRNRTEAVIVARDLGICEDTPLRSS